METLSGGDRRSLGRAHEVLCIVLREPARLAEVIECLWHEDPVVRMRASDVVEKFSRERPELLRPLTEELLGLASETRQIELRWHLAQILPRLNLTDVNRRRAIKILQSYLEDRSSIVKTFAMESLATIADDPGPLIEEVSRTGTPAMKARARKLLKKYR